MPYIASDGRILEKPPWSIQRLIDIIWGIFAFILFFFKTLVGLDTSTNSGNRSSRSGGPGGPGNGPGGGPKRIGRITTVEDCSMPGGG